MAKMTASKPMGVAGKGMTKIKAHWVGRVETYAYTLPNR